jgi:tight adherence protein B
VVAVIGYRVRRASRLRPSTSRRSLAARADALRVGRFVAARLATAGVAESPFVFVRRAIGWAVAAGALGCLWLGRVGAAGGLIVAAALPVVGLRRRRRSRAARLDEALPATLDGMAAALRAGTNLAQALEEADPPPPLDDAFRAAKDRLRVGASLDEALGEFSERAGTTQAALVATALTLGYRSGGDLPRVLDVLAEVGRDRARLAREIRVATAQARLSSWVVALMPVAFLFLMGAASRDQSKILLHTPAGWALLGAGGFLEAIGILWMRRLEEK